MGSAPVYKKQRRRRWEFMQGKVQALLGTAVLLGSAGFGLACSSAGSSSAMGMAGTETFSGTEHLTSAQAASMTYVPVIPLTAAGAFKDTGSISLTPGSGANGSGPGPAVIKLVNGDIKVEHGATNPNAEPRPLGGCVYGMTQKVAYTITGGTGTYAGATGKGTATVNNTFLLPKLADGECNTATSAVPLSGSVVFSATGPVSVP